MTEEPKARKSKRVKLSPAEKETRNEILKKMQENGEFERYATLSILFLCELYDPHNDKFLSDLNRHCTPTSYCKIHGETR
jgi:hypothetical protein